MIELKKEDFLWKCYERYYKYAPAPKPPRSICNFFWKAVGGMFAWVFWDSMILVTGTVILAMFLGLIWAFKEVDGFNNPVPYGMVLFLSIFCLGFINLGFFVVRYVEFWRTKEKTGAIVLASTAIVAALAFLSFVISLGFKGAREWDWVYLLYGLITTVGICAGMGAIFGILVFFSAESSTGKVIRAYLGSFKDWACPLVSSPWDNLPQETPTQETADVERADVDGIYSIPGPIPVLGYLLRCSKCKRKILVESFLNGSSHVMHVAAKCAECMPSTEHLKSTHPEVVNQIEEWVKP